MSNSSKNQPRKCSQCGSSYTYLDKTKNGIVYPHWNKDPYIEDTWLCGKCSRNRRYHGKYPTKSELKEIQANRMNARICDDCKSVTPKALLPWHHHPDKDGAYLCAVCYQRRYYAPKRKFNTKQELNAYLSQLFSGTGNPMYDKHINIGRTYTDDRNRRVSEAVKKWAAIHPEHYYRMGTLGAAKTRELGLNGIPTKLEQIMEKALKTYHIEYVPQYNFTIGRMDFYIPDSNIAVFVDGTCWHADPRIFEAGDILFFGKTAEWVWKKDLRQTNYLKSQGYIVLRFWEKEVTENIDSCIKVILQTRENSNLPL